MIVKCPSCGTRLLVQRSIFGERKREAICAQCRTTLMIGPLPPLRARNGTLKPLVDTKPRHTISHIKSSPRTLLSHIKSHKRLWTAVPLCFLAICIISLQFEIASTVDLKFQKSQEISPAKALKVRNLTLRWVTRDSSIELAIEGELANFSDNIVQSQNLKIVLLDKNDSPLLTWDHKIPAQFIQPQQYLIFRATTDVPPKEAVAALVKLGSSSAAPNN